MNFEEPDIPVGVELEVSVEHINADNDPVFTAVLGAQTGYLVGNPFGYRSRHSLDTETKTFLTLILAILIKMMPFE